MIYCKQPRKSSQTVSNVLKLPFFPPSLKKNKQKRKINVALLYVSLDCNRYLLVVACRLSVLLFGIYNHLNLFSCYYLLFFPPSSDKSFAFAFHFFFFVIFPGHAYLLLLILTVTVSTFLVLTIPNQCRCYIH